MVSAALAGLLHRALAQSNTVAAGVAMVVRKPPVQRRAAAVAGHLLGQGQMGLMVKSDQTQLATLPPTVALGGLLPRVVVMADRVVVTVAPLPRPPA
jgi:hypothetical protein